MRNATQPNNLEQTLTQEQKVNLGNLKWIMNSEKTTLPSLRNIEWRTVKTETNKINQAQPYISTNNITELNELIDARKKLVFEKIRIPSKSAKKESKPGWEIRLKTQIKKIYDNRSKWWNKGKMLEHVETKTKRQHKKFFFLKLGEINQKVL